jgi:hypothetical protein
MLYRWCMEQVGRASGRIGCKNNVTWAVKQRVCKCGSDDVWGLKDDEEHMHMQTLVRRTLHSCTNAVSGDCEM